MERLTRLRLARLRAGKSQFEVSLETGIPQSYLSLYERGFRIPKENHLLLMGKCYGLESNELAKGLDLMTNNLVMLEEN